MNDHALRLRAQQQEAARRAAMEQLRKRTTPLIRWVLLATLATLIGLWLYAAGQESTLRTCPEEQHGRRLLTSEQRPDGALCRYADTWEDYGRRVTRRKAVRP